MSTLEHTVVLINSLCALVAFVANTITSKSAPPPWKVIRALVAVLALIYSGAYMWLYLNPDKLASWSSTMRGVSILSWPIVWIWPAIVTYRVIRLSRRVAVLSEQLDARETSDRAEQALDPETRGEFDR